MVAARLDRRAAARVDASDVVQDTLTDAAGQLDEYLRDSADAVLALAPAACRRADQENAPPPPVRPESQRHAGEPPARMLSDESAVELGRQFVARDTSPSNRVMRQELCDAVMEAVAELSARDREVLLMRHIEKLGTAEIADALGMAEAGVKARLLSCADPVTIRA